MSAMLLPLHFNRPSLRPTHAKAPLYVSVEMTTPQLLVVLTTIPHFFAAINTPKPYSAIVLLSAGLSTVWHGVGEARWAWLAIADHLAAGAWFAADCWYFWGRPQAWWVFWLNGMMAYLNLMFGTLDHEGFVPYWVGHSVWHVLSVIKCLYVARLLTLSSSLS